MVLKTKMIVDSIRWSLERKGIPVYIEHKGDRDAGAIYIKHDKGQGLYDVYHRVNDYNEGKRIKFLNTFTEERLDEFFKKQIDKLFSNVLSGYIKFYDLSWAINKIKELENEILELRKVISDKEK